MVDSRRAGVTSVEGNLDYRFVCLRANTKRLSQGRVVQMQADIVETSTVGSSRIEYSIIETDRDVGVWHRPLLLVEHIGFHRIAMIDFVLGHSCACEGNRHGDDRQRLGRNFSYQMCVWPPLSATA